MSRPPKPLKYVRRPIGVSESSGIACKRGKSGGVLAEAVDAGEAVRKQPDQERSR
jgi:hypothetical protein